MWVRPDRFAGRTQSELACAQRTLISMLGGSDWAPLMISTAGDHIVTVIAGSLSTLPKEGDVTIDEAAQRELLETAYAGVERLIRLVDGLLPMAKLEANAG
jgi:signal transduction histidine kinase